VQQARVRQTTILLAGHADRFPPIELFLVFPPIELFLVSIAARRHDPHPFGGIERNNYRE